jgi:hypothetical protein
MVKHYVWGVVVIFLLLLLVLIDNTCCMKTIKFITASLQFFPKLGSQLRARDII